MAGQTIRVFVKGYSRETLTLTLNDDSPIDELFDGIANDTHVDKTDIWMVYGAKPLQSQLNGKSMRLKDYGIRDLAILHVYFTLPGELSDDVEYTNDPDMITLDDDPTNPRLKMPCGHAIGPESLAAFCRALLSAGKYHFRCPSTRPNCGELWDYITIRKLAALTPEEQNEFEIKLSNNYLRRAEGIQECPKCSSFCKRRDRKKPRVVCLICSKRQILGYEFCWYCRKDWLTSGNKGCGNPTCDGTDPRLKLLKNAQIKSICGVNCPSIRACPTCGILTEHKGMSRNINCVCGERFCFICLQKAVSEGFSCGIPNTTCIVAPTQNEVPGE